MRITRLIIITIILAVFILAGCSSGPVVENVIPEKYNPGISQRINEFRIDFVYRKVKFHIPYGSKIDSVDADTVKNKITIGLNENFSYQPFRKENVAAIYKEVKSIFGDKFSDYSYLIKTLNRPIEDLIPNFFRDTISKYDSTRMPKSINNRPEPVVRNVSKSYIPGNGLYGKNIVIWPSHGWYYDNKEGRWEWQRPRLFQSVEDKLPLSFVVPYLMPMLENAGAVVFDPRERDVQSHSVIVDNDSPTDVKSKYYIEKNQDKKNHWKDGGAGFSVGNLPYPSGYNPFTKGTNRIINSDNVETASVNWIPDIPESGEYGVYVSYSASDNNVSDAEYIVYHCGIKTIFNVNQAIGGGTWIYLGKFKFEKGYNPEIDKVILTNKSKDKGKIVSADAVRLGGGEGVIERGGTVSGRPKVFEAARYYLQYAGMPDSLVYNLDHDTSDYADDYKCRAEYVNYLYGKPFGPNKDTNVKGLGIPIDLSLAFHTDAGIQHNDTTVGTLAIYSIPDFKKVETFPDGVSRLANRDLADIIQTQIVDDIRTKYDSSWTRRQLKNSDYSEAVRPNVPSVLIELLSHQNMNDMKYALDPSFRFDVSRAIYKGILKYLSAQYKYPYVVEPLPVKSFSTVFDNEGNVILRWKPVIDTLEPTSKPDRYIVYTRIANGSFDNGTITNEPMFVFKNAEKSKIYSFKVTAINKGGESFPSEILSACKMDKEPVMIVNGFYRVSGPAIMKDTKYNGFLNTVDPGMPDKYDLSYTGSQYDFDSTHQFISNDEPGWGASYADNEARIIAGNTFDYPFVHGEAIKEAGYSFISAGADAVEDSSISLNRYKLVDLILGAQKSVSSTTNSMDSLKEAGFKAFPVKLQKTVAGYLQTGGNLFVSGSYIASDLFNAKKPDSADINFAEKVLRYKFDAGHASKNGEVYAAIPQLSGLKNIKYNTMFNDSIYASSSSDAVAGINGSKVILRYAENNFPAGTLFKSNYGVITLGFPFETIESEKTRNGLMKEIINMLMR